MGQYYCTQDISQKKQENSIDGIKWTCNYRLQMQYRSCVSLGQTAIIQSNDRLNLSTVCYVSKVSVIT